MNSRQSAVAAVIAAILLVTLLGWLTWQADGHTHATTEAPISEVSEPAIVVPGTGPGWPNIGGHPIPWGLVCQEDEAMLLTHVDTIGCRPLDDLIPPKEASGK